MKIPAAELDFRGNDIKLRRYDTGARNLDLITLKAMRSSDKPSKRRVNTWVIALDQVDAQGCAPAGGGKVRAGEIEKGLLDAVRAWGGGDSETEAEDGGEVHKLTYCGRVYTLVSAPMYGAGPGTSRTVVVTEAGPVEKTLLPGTARKRFGLTEREAQVVEGITRGLSNRDIAQLLSICEYTVKDHIKNIMKKMGVGRRTLIFRRALDPYG